MTVRLEFRPQEVLMDPKALDYPLAREWENRFRELNIPVTTGTTAARSRSMSSLDPPQRFRQSKRTLVVSVRHQMQCETCRPSADYQLALVSGCPGHCQYCYLNTNFGPYPYVRVYANQDEILEHAARLIREADHQLTFEAAATSDPVAVEPLTLGLRRAVTFFAAQERGHLRFVTKFSTIESLLDIDHRGHTTARVSVNIPEISGQLEQGVPPVETRLEAAGRLAQAGYPVGYMLGPVFLVEGWREAYTSLLSAIRAAHPAGTIPPTFEIITHRFTTRAKNLITTVYPETCLNMDESQRVFKYGQFGYGKFVYPPEAIHEVRQVLGETVSDLFPEASLLYTV